MKSEQALTRLPAGPTRVGIGLAHPFTLVRRLTSGSLGLLVLACIVAAAILGLLLMVLRVSLETDVTQPSVTLQNYTSLYTDSFAYQTFLNTIGFALITLLVALLCGVPIAWLLERTDIVGKPMVLTVMTIGVLIPAFCPAMGWLFLLHPRIGILNQLAKQLFGLQNAPVSIVTVPGMGWVEGLALAPVIFIMSAASFRAMDPALEESARMSGATITHVLKRVTLPLAFPGLLAAALYVLTIGISAFDIPAIIGFSSRIFTFSTYLYIEIHPLIGLPQYGLPAAFSTFMVLLAIGLSWWYSRVLVNARKYQVMTGKNYQPRPVRLGHWNIVAWAFLGGYLLLSQILPLLVLAWIAFTPFFEVPSLKAIGTMTAKSFGQLPWSLVSEGAVHTVILALGAPTLAIVFSLVLSWVILRTRYRFRYIFDFIAFLPHAIPSIIFGVGALLVALFVIRGPVDLYGSVLLLLLLYAIVQTSFGTRITNAALLQIHPDLEEAGSISGAPGGRVFGRIVAPLLKPAVMYGWVWLALLTFRELTLATLLFSPSNVTFPVVVWNLWNGSQLAQASAVTLLMLAVLLPLMLLYWKVGHRGGASAMPGIA